MLTSGLPPLMLWNLYVKRWRQENHSHLQRFFILFLNFIAHPKNSLNVGGMLWVRSAGDYNFFHMISSVGRRSWYHAPSDTTNTKEVVTL